MQYATLTEEDLSALRQERLRELEVMHYRYMLEEGEDPERNVARMRALAAIEYRIMSYREQLGFTHRSEDEAENTQTGRSEP